jgi:hypothetical protein
MFPSFISTSSENLIADWAISFIVNTHTHTTLNLSSNSHHHPSNKQSLLSTLAHRVRFLCDLESLHSELHILRDTFRQNGYKRQADPTGSHSTGRVASVPERPVSVTFLPYVSTTFNCIIRMLSRHNIKSVGLPPRNIPSFHRHVKDDLGLNTLGVYSVFGKCGQIYIEQTGHSIETIVEEHQSHIRLEHPDKSAVAENRIDLDHHIQIQNTTILSTKSRCMDQMIKEAILIKLHPNMNREDGLRPSWSWKPLIHSINARRKPPIQCLS